MVAAKIHKSTWIIQSNLGKVNKSRGLFELSFEKLNSANSDYENDLLRVLPELNKKFKKVRLLKFPNSKE